MTERLDALCVEESNGKSYFTKIGAAFANRNGGYTLKLRAIPAPEEGSYKILLVEPKPRDGQKRQPAPAFAQDYTDDVPFD